MLEIRRTAEFSDWLRNLRDRQAKARVIVRLERAAEGNLGDVKSVGDGVGEIRITYGPGYRLYFVQKGEVVVIMLCGGDKSSQARDIRNAKAMAKELK
jgi:putative addiction module killer protein